MQAHRAYTGANTNRNLELLEENQTSRHQGDLLLQWLVGQEIPLRDPPAIYLLAIKETVGMSFKVTGSSTRLWS